MEEYFWEIEREQPHPHEIERERARGLEHLKARRNLLPISGPAMLNIAMAAARDALGPEKSLTLADIMEYGVPALMRLHRKMEAAKPVAPPKPPKEPTTKKLKMKMRFYYA